MVVEAYGKGVDVLMFVRDDTLSSIEIVDHGDARPALSQAGRTYPLGATFNGHPWLAVIREEKRDQATPRRALPPDEYCELRRRRAVARCTRDLQ